jgi:hypothetical protein
MSRPPRSAALLSVLSLVSYLSSLSLCRPLPSLFLFLVVAVPRGRIFLPALLPCILALTSVLCAPFHGFYRIFLALLLWASLDLSSSLSAPPF